MAAPRNRIGEILVRLRVIDELQMRSALAQHDQWGGRLSRIITDMGLATEDVIVQAISKGLGVQRVRLDELERDAGALAKLDVGLAEQKGVFPVALRDNGKTLVLAMSDPSDLETIDQVAARSRTRVVPMVAGDREIEHAILRHYRNQEPVVSTHAIGHPGKQGSGDDEEFKVVDMSGKTVVKRIADIKPPEAPRPASNSTADLLDEILNAPEAPEAVFSPEELERLKAVQLNQEKSSKVLRALLELLLEKGAMQQRELAAKMRSS